MPVTVENAFENRPEMRRYLILLGGFFCGFALVAMALLAANVRYNFFSSQHGDASYRDLGGRQVPQVQDQDVFYSNVGNSIAATKRADIVFLGPSFVGFAVDRDTLQSSPLVDRLKIYNMSFIGVRSGEFSRLLINRWDLRAPLWIINVDDQEQHFFSADLNLSIGVEKTPIAAVTRSRVNGFLKVIGREIKWQIEELIAAIKMGHRYSPAGLYRNVSNGDIVLANNPSYLAKHKPIFLRRDPDCHTNPTVVDYARKFLKEVGGNVVFMLVPHSRACVRQAVELASALNVELITPSFDGITSLDDGGSHLDKEGAKIFTSYLVAELVKTHAFKEAFAAKMTDLK